MVVSHSCIKHVALPKHSKNQYSKEHSLMKKEPTEKQLPSTPDNAKHKSRQVKKKTGDTSGKKAPSKK
jgi:hypothetical protein